MAPVALTSTGNSRAALMRPRAAAHKPAPAANKGALAARFIAEPKTISVSPARKTRKPAASGSLFRENAAAAVGL